MTDTFMDAWDIDDGYDWHCNFCGEGFYLGARRFIVDEESCCEACNVDNAPPSKDAVPADVAEVEADIYAEELP